MLSSELKESFLSIIRLGVGHEAYFSAKTIDWNAIETLAAQHGLAAIALDGIERLPEDLRPPKELLLNWIGEVLQEEQVYAEQQKAADKMAVLFNRNEIRTYVLKGDTIAECYPKLNHRSKADMDCYLLPNIGDFDAWTLGNDLIKSLGYEVSTDYYKNSTFLLPGLTVESHQFLTPFRGNKRLTMFEKVLQALLHKDKGEDRFDGRWLYRPPVMVSALFLIEHAFSHFLHEGLTWKHVLDWLMFKNAHNKDINWMDFDAFIDEFGFRKFYNSYNQIGRFLLGEIHEKDLNKKERRMMVDVWVPLDLHENHLGVKGKLALAGNTWRARWKYRYFTDMNWLHALWIQAKGVLFIKHPSLSSL